MTCGRRCPSSCGASARTWPAAATSAGSRWSASSWTAPRSPPGGPAVSWATICAAWHTAAVLWTDPRRPDQAGLAAAAEALGTATRARQVLTVIASSSSVWAWLAVAADTGADAIAAATGQHPGVRVAVGPVGAGTDGFRRSHFDAVVTQRLMARRPDLRVARFADVQLVALALTDEQRAREFVARTLGKLADADADGELRDTLCVYIGEQFSAARAARALYTHRNTVLNRLQRAERLLPLPLAGHGLEVGVALEIAQWLGTLSSATHE